MREAATDCSLPPPGISGRQLVTANSTCIATAPRPGMRRLSPRPLSSGTTGATGIADKGSLTT